MFSFGQFQPSAFLAPASPLSLFSIDTSYEYMRFINNSPYQLNVNIGGMSYTVTEFKKQDVLIPPVYQGRVIITPSVVITTSGHGQANQLTVEAYWKGELTDPSTENIPQQAVTTTASGQPLFTAHFGLGAAANAVQTLNIFNPPNSGVNMTFHAAKVFTNSTGVPQAVLATINGADLNLATPVAAVSHNGQANPPVSFAHCTFDDVAVGHGGISIETGRLPGRVSNNTIDLLTFPDNVILSPGNNLLVVCSGSTAGDVIELSIKWTESIAVQAFGGIPTGVATSVINDGNPLQQVLEATKLGDSPSDIFIMNDGTITTKGTLSLNQINDFNGRGLISVTDTGPGTQNTRIQADTAIRFQVPAGTDRANVTSTGMNLLSGTLGLLVGSVSRVSVFTGSANNVGTLQAHGLGVKPDWVGLTETGTAGDTNTFSWDVAASDATNIKVWTNNATARTYIAIAIKL